MLPHVARLGHPGYLAFIPGRATWPGALGDLIASALNLDTCWWLGAAGPTALELTVLGWFRDWIGYPADRRRRAGLGRVGGQPDRPGLRPRGADRRDDARTRSLYLSDQTHSSLARGARVLGFRPDQVRVLPTDERMRMRPDALARRDGGRPGGRPAPRWWSSPTPAPPTRAPSTRCAELAADLPRAGRLAARRRGVRRVRLPHRARRRGAVAASSSPTRSRSTRTSGCTSRSRRARCWSATASLLRAGVRDHPDYLKDIEAVAAARSTSPTTACS